MNPNDQKHSQRFRSALEWSRRQMEPFRKNRYRWIQQFVGTHYSDSGADKKVPVNLLELAVNIYVRHLAGGTPRFDIDSDHAELRPGAYDLELALNHLLKELRFRDTLRSAVRAAMFGTSVIKQGLASMAVGEVDGFMHHAGQPFADLVSMDDWVHDMRAKRYEKIQFAGDRYRIRLDEARDMPHWNKKLREQLQPTTQSSINQPSGDEREETISQDHDTDVDELEPMVELWDVWFPLEGLVATYPAEGDATDGLPVNVVEWTGREGGPYHRLAYNEVPGQLMPLPPVALMIDLHDLTNRLFRKLGHQAERQKSVLGFSGAAQQDAERVIDVPDGKGFRVDNPQQMKEMRFGGVDGPTLAFALQLRDIFGYLAGNLDALGGLGPQADTLGQDQLLTAAASQRLNDMRDQTVDFVDRVGEGLATDLWTDPAIELPIVKRLGNYEVGVPATFSAERREGDFLDYNMSLDPYSLEHTSPGLQLDNLRRTVNELILPLLPSMESQGVTVDAVELVDQVARLTNQPELNDILAFEGGPRGPRGGVTEPRQSPVTTRRYERVNRPGATRQGKDQVLSSALLGVKSQPSEQAAAFRPSGT